MLAFWAGAALADTFRIATYAAPLSRDGPGLLLRDIQRGEDPQIAAIAAVIAEVKPDILLLTDFDYDLDGLALTAMADFLRDKGVTYDHRFALLPNAGMATGLDLDANGRFGEARDAQGYGRFSGDGGMALLSRFPIDKTRVRDLSATLWRDKHNAQMPPMADDVLAAQRLSSTGHWIVPIMIGQKEISLMAFSATPPVFDGPEDRNGLRNRDELLLWSDVLNGLLGPAPTDFVIAGNANLDPDDGDGLRTAMRDFLADPRIQDPEPTSAGGVAAADANHVGNPALDTADWPDTKPGNLRVSYILPAKKWMVQGAGVFWPARDDPKFALLGGEGLAAGPHRLVWVDLLF